MKIAMWSGPRNLNTAMMYSFAARSDCAVIDAPFYAAYLAQTGADHPMRSMILESQPNDPTVVAAALVAKNPEAKPIFFQKHMTHHMVPGIPWDWITHVTNVFLIRHPARVIASYADRRDSLTFEDLGYRQQAEIYERVLALGRPPVVIDSADLCANPNSALRVLCAVLRIPFDPAMLSWPTGGHSKDGVWAAHWYQAAHKNSGFVGPEGPLPDLTGRAADLCAQAMPYFERLKLLALRFPPPS